MPPRALNPMGPHDFRHMALALDGNLAWLMAGVTALD